MRTVSVLTNVVIRGTTPAIKAAIERLAGRPAEGSSLSAYVTRVLEAHVGVSAPANVAALGSFP